MPTTADAFGSMMVLSVEPALTVSEQDTFREAAGEQIRSGARWFILDLSGVGRFDSQGLEVLVWFQEQVEAADGDIKVAGLKGLARQTFEIVRFEKKFEVFDSVHEAVKSFH
ncbi:MAG: STAS domain-containing protein [Planctomycetota bacterium]|nr:STAS domain-containing protein [Planctomycetota bacterium]